MEHQIIKNFQEKLQGVQNILLTTHIIPDADGIGSQIGLCLALRRMGKNAWCVNEEPLLERYKYMDPEDVVLGLTDLHEAKHFPEGIDLCMVIDTNTVERIGDKMKDFITNDSKNVLYIDHHPCKKDLIKDHCIDPSAAATGEIAGELILSMGISFDKHMALPLYTAILIDTSCFRYPTVTGTTHRLIGTLMDAGVDSPNAYNGIYGTKKIPYMHLLGSILLSANSNQTEEIAWIVLSYDQLEHYDSHVEDTHGFINNLLVLDNIKVACMFRDDGDSVKVSLRSSGDYDVGSIARVVGGGGHSHAAATVIKYKEGQKLEDIIKYVVSEIEKILASL